MHTHKHMVKRGGVRDGGGGGVDKAVKQGGHSSTDVKGGY